MEGRDFPHCSDGDVMIVLAPGRFFQLHSDVLKRSSGFFQEVLTEENAIYLSEKAKRQGVCIRYRLELVERPSDDSMSAGVLELVELDNNARVIGGRRALPELDAGKIPTKLFT
ncbi:hypothetical protein LTS18_009588, partial [Coniosporium uncinatum]